MFKLKSESGQFEESERQVYNIILIKALTNPCKLTVGLPVHQIISAMEDQMREVEEDGDEGVQGGLEDEDE